MNVLMFYGGVKNKILNFFLKPPRHIPYLLFFMAFLIAHNFLVEKEKGLEKAGGSFKSHKNPSFLGKPLETKNGQL